LLGVRETPVTATRWLARNSSAASLTFCMAPPFAAPCSPRSAPPEGWGPTATQALPAGRARADGPDQDGTIGPGEVVVPGAEHGKQHQVRRGSGWSGDLAATRGGSAGGVASWEGEGAGWRR